jgi:hypothetical protein
MDMFELPEMITLARQAYETIQEKIIRERHLGNSPHKFGWYNQKPEEFTRLTEEKTVGKAHVKGRWLCDRTGYHISRSPAPAPFLNGP